VGKENPSVKSKHEVEAVVAVSVLPQFWAPSVLMDTDTINVIQDDEKMTYL